jgi:hypothetical protein
MPKQITQYNLLISCPSDVKEELEIIEETIKKFNQSFGAMNNINIVVKHWSTDSYPEAGGQPQELLNKQFVLDSDLAVAVFWTRFGTPTEQYGSGTEEEIEELIKSDKQVFLYFSDRLVPPSEFNSEQYQKVADFKSKYEGIYGSFQTSEQLRTNFFNHLTQYFMSKVIGTEENQTTWKRLPGLSIRALTNGELTNKTHILKSNLVNSELVKNMRQDISNLIKLINEINLPKEKTENKLEFTSSQVNIFPTISIDMADKKETIERYLKENLNNIDHLEFYNIGGLKKIKQIGGNLFRGGTSYQLVGTDQEKEKYQLIKKLHNKIKELEQYVSYFSKMESKCCLKFALSNTGEKFDEDIDVKLFIKKGLICKKENLPYPGDLIINIITENIEGIYQPKKSHVIEEYPDYFYTPSMPNSFPIFAEDKKEHERSEYEKELGRLFCYEYFVEDEHDVICYNQQYIKQNTNTYLPSVLVFDSPPQEITYEIRSKHFPDVFKGEIDIV